MSFNAAVNMLYQWCGDLRNPYKVSELYSGSPTGGRTTNAFITDCFATQETQGAVFEHWGITLGLGIVPVLEIAQNYYPGFGSDWVAIFVGFYNQNAHRR
eukprot:scaffold152614_cov80-Cyclotella_meneghiniana.AAC.8